MSSLIVAQSISTNVSLLGEIARNYRNDPTIIKWARDPSKWAVRVRTDSDCEQFVEDYFGCDVDDLEEEHSLYAVAILNPDVLDDYSGAQFTIYGDTGIWRVETHQGETYIL